MNKQVFGKTADGQTVHIYTLANTAGLIVKLLDYGALLQSIIVPTSQGVPVDVILGFDTIEEYEKDTSHQGSVIGRVANRISGAEFELNGKKYILAKNNKEHCLHGGKKGFERYVFEATKVADNAIKFSRFSPDGEENFPGNMQMSVTYTLTDKGELVLDYFATCDDDTPVNLTNHVYFNLDGGGTHHNHVMHMPCEQFLANVASGVPTGEFVNVAGTAFDFRTPKTIAQDLFSGDAQVDIVGGYDHNMVFGKVGKMKVMADVKSTLNSIGMEVSSTLPGVQFYSGNFLTPRNGKGGQTYDKHGGFCLETQHYPDSVNHPEFPSCILKKGDEYSHRTIFKFYKF